MRVYNLTDHPNFTSSVILIKGGKILPGESIEIKEVDLKIKGRKDVAIGTPPIWYLDWKFPKISPLFEERFLPKKEIVISQPEIKEVKEEKKPPKKK